MAKASKKKANGGSRLALTSHKAGSSTTSTKNKPNGTSSSTAALPAPPMTLAALPREILDTIVSFYVDDFWDQKPRHGDDMGDTKPQADDKKGVARASGSLLQIQPLLLVSKGIYQTALPILYRSVVLTSSDMYREFLTRPHPTSYKHIEKLAFEFEEICSLDWLAQNRRLVNELKDRLVYFGRTGKIKPAPIKKEESMSASSSLEDKIDGEDLNTDSKPTKEEIDPATNPDRKPDLAAIKAKWTGDGGQRVVFDQGSGVPLDLMPEGVTMWFHGEVLQACAIGQLFRVHTLSFTNPTATVNFLTQRRFDPWWTVPRIEIVITNPQQIQLIGNLPANYPQVSTLDVTWASPPPTLLQIPRPPEIPEHELFDEAGKRKKKDPAQRLLESQYKSAVAVNLTRMDGWFVEVEQLKWTLRDIAHRGVHVSLGCGDESPHVFCQTVHSGKGKGRTETSKTITSVVQRSDKKPREKYGPEWEVKWFKMKVKQVLANVESDRALLSERLTLDSCAGGCRHAKSKTKSEEFFYEVFRYNQRLRDIIPRYDGWGDGGLYD